MRGGTCSPRPRPAQCAVAERPKPPGNGEETARDPAASPINGVVPPVEHRFKKGSPGSPGRPRSRPLTMAVREALARGDVASVRDLAETALRRAKAGDFRFWKEILDRLDGPVRQEIAAEVTTRSADELIAEMDAAPDEEPGVAGGDI